ncbi:hypothetical protein K437DRAFT_293145 [Tilletiaria anomala UBC 951]|uniref:Uncharacterized protein n=1 Tax=Tilletiaria anomala (strain ATCC 24038 / CBS 436.72 / UBC 951) TaxID=1037660 RepID=A0A066WP62_TILAU|nr:uncharacterized protein K437DRAFT_293145 [Tilletiaria anomala UBC 951]KDN52390.1 hypothetical protein K437DRAFT_293145 [Tilletiaria anomala UBC 951]
MSEREQLLGDSSRQARQATSSTGDTSSKYHEAHPVSRWIGALSTGSLPSNDQIFTALYKTAGALDGFAAIAAQEGEDDPTLQSRRECRVNEQADNAPTSPQRAAHQVFRETAMLFREFGRWITRPDADVVIDEPDEPDVENAASKRMVKVPDGNSREQIQRVIYHARNTRIQGQADIPSAGKTKEAPIQVGEDAPDLLSAATQLILKVLTSDEGQFLANDLFLAFRNSLANPVPKAQHVAAIIEEKTKAAVDAIRSSEYECTHPVPTIEPPNQSEEAVKKDARKAVKAELSSPRPNQNEDVDMDPDEMIDYASERLASLLGNLDSDSSSVDALETMLQICKKYIQHGAVFVQTVKEAPTTAGNPVKITSERMHVEANRHLDRCLHAAGELLEGLAGGTSLAEIKAGTAKLVQNASGDDNVRQWVTDMGDFFQDAITQARLHTRTTWAGAGSGEMGTSASGSGRLQVFKERIKSLLRKGHDLFDSNPGIQSDVQHVIVLLDNFKQKILQDERNASIRGRITKIFALLNNALKGGVRAAKREWKEFMADILSVILPSAFDLIKILPVPRVEFTSDKLDAVVDHVAIPTVNLIPDVVNVQSAHDFTWRKDAGNSDVTSALKVTVSGLRFAVNDISFYVCERYTSPQPSRCGGCCGCGASRSWGDGPASWFSYEESALLDAGFEGEGISATVDLKTIETKNNDEEEKRTRFFEVRDTALNISHSFVFNLRQSRHWILNALLLSIARPTIKLVLERVGAAQLQHGFEKVDEKMFDIYARARYHAWERYHKKGSLADVNPGVWHFLRVLFSSTAGKTPERIAREKKEADDAKKEAGKKQAEQHRIIDSQPHPVNPLEIKPSAIIKNDKFGSYQLAFGMSSHLLPGKSGTPPLSSKTDNALPVGEMPPALSQPSLFRLARAAQDEAVKATVATTNVLFQIPEVAERERKRSGETDGDEEYAWKSAAFDI